jgi:protein-S-isoprenylcysteine O-methyltransferase Ste14
MSADVKDGPDVVVRPPRLYLASLVLGLILHFLWPVSLGLPAAFRFSIGPFVTAFGVLVVGVAIRGFKAAGTNVPTIKPATALVTDGLHRISRNPIYIGLSLIYVGIAVMANSLWVLGLLVPILVVIHYGVVLREERYLEERFAEEYRRYKSSVRRWF